MFILARTSGKKLLYPAGEMVALCQVSKAHARLMLERLAVLDTLRREYRIRNFADFIDGFGNEPTYPDVWFLRTPKDEGDLFQKMGYGIVGDAVVCNKATILEHIPCEDLGPCLAPSWPQPYQADESGAWTFDSRPTVARFSLDVHIADRCESFACYGHADRIVTRPIVTSVLQEVLNSEDD